ncbi:hypothetical protein A2V49_02900 [candidate division WWE3 bacterium RBG_19FT_COMBO_34_6]|uniref:SAM-dependent MTase RsmB/NOP-type domain-containing protein n=1 Tax=candidate division WWE3 bacterium RBG_19FT_COMBO_34_6 TaxID=1802612 RepID=A0A1F4UKH6_UNCKA|nr:MAG: hypothetical protein A2V49_02900 [candidate division WWE3 bacterium RBG_19FT_COMBO_34_6]
MEKKDIFINKIQKIFGPKYLRVLQHLYTRPNLSFRINNNKISEKDALSRLKLAGFGIKAGPLHNSFILISSPPNKRLSETELFEKGYIYIQSLSSMIPVLMLDPKQGDNILDLCAAPGSKTSQITDIVSDKAHVVAVDNNKKRMYKLSENIKNQNIKNVEIIYSNGVGLERKYRNFVGFFDKVLVDAPCSNEGLICLTDPDSFYYWNPKLPKKLSKLQKKLVSSAINMLKPGGALVYSTCTFSREENEDVVAWIVEKFKNMSLIEVKKIIPDGQFTAFFAVKFVKLG